MIVIVVLKVLSFLKKGYVWVRGGTEYSIPDLPSRSGMKDCFLDTLFSPGEACLNGEEILTCPCIYIKA